MPELVVVLDEIPADWGNALRNHLPEGMVLRSAQGKSVQNLKTIIADADYAIALNAPVTSEVLHASQKLKLLHKWGVGVDNLDLEAARTLGIKVARTTGSNAIPVAEFAIGLMLSALRCISFSNAELKIGKWHGGVLPTQTFMLSGKTVGIIGLGSIGNNLARLLKGFGCRIIYNKTTRLDESEEARLGVEFGSVSDLLERSDIVSICCPLTPQTAGLIDRAALLKMKRSAVLVNVARGGIVVEDDLVQALRDGTIMAAAMDVFEVEPLPADSALLEVNNLVVTPHIAANASDNFEKTIAQMMKNIGLVSKGEAVSAEDAIL